MHYGALFSCGEDDPRKFRPLDKANAVDDVESASEPPSLHQWRAEVATILLEQALVAWGCEELRQTSDFLEGN